MKHLATTTGSCYTLKFLGPPIRYYFHFEDMKMLICNKTLRAGNFTIGDEQIEKDNPLLYCPLCSENSMPRSRSIGIVADLDDVPVIDLKQCFLDGCLPDSGAKRLEISSGTMKALVSWSIETGIPFYSEEAPAFSYKRHEPNASRHYGIRSAIDVASLENLNVRAFLSEDIEKLMCNTPFDIDSAINPYGSSERTVWKSYLDTNYSLNEVIMLVAGRHKMKKSDIASMIANIKPRRHFSLV